MWHKKNLDQIWPKKNLDQIWTKKIWTRFGLKKVGLFWFENFWTIVGPKKILPGIAQNCLGLYVDLDRFGPSFIYFFKMD